MKKNVSLFVLINFMLSTHLNAVSTVEVMDPPATRLFVGHRQYSVYPCETNEKPFYEGRRGTSEIYKEREVLFPRSPLFHPYHPLGEEDVAGGVVHHARIDGGIPKFPLIVHIPPEAHDQLPGALRDKIAEHNIDIADSLRITFVVQDLPWSQDSVICFRPQYGTDGHAAGGRTYWTTRDIETGLFCSHPHQVHFEGHAPNTFIKDQISIHPAGSTNPGDGIEGDLVLSGNNLHMHGLDPLSNNGESLWSAVLYQDAGKPRFLATLHWLLGDRQATELSETLRDVFPTLGTFPYANLQGLFKRIKELPSFRRQGGHFQQLEPFYPFLVDLPPAAAGGGGAPAVAAQEAVAAVEDPMDRVRPLLHATHALPDVSVAIRGHAQAIAPQALFDEALISELKDRVSKRTIPAPQGDVAMYASNIPAQIRSALSGAISRINRLDDHEEIHNVLTPAALDAEFDRRISALETALRGAPELTPRLQSHIQRVNDFRDVCRSHLSALEGDLTRILENVQRILQTIPPQCGDEYALHLDEARKLEPLRAAYENLLQELQRIFPTDNKGIIDVYQVRAQCFPDLGRPQGAAAAGAAAGGGGGGAAAVARKPLVWDGFPQQITAAAQTFQISLDGGLKDAAQRHGAHESIMGIGSGAVARGLFRQIEPIFPELADRFSLPPLALMNNVTDFLGFIRELQAHPLGGQIPFPSEHQIHDTFTHQTTTFSDPYAHVDNKIPYKEYLKAWSFLRSLFHKAKDVPQWCDELRFTLNGATQALIDQGTHCGAGMFGRTLLLYTSMVSFMKGAQRPN